MFRVSHFMQELISPTPVAPRRDFPGPVVIWNLIRRCNLLCKHCYSISGDTEFPGELSTREVFDVMDDLKSSGVPVLILSGGEPLLRPDIFEISHRAKSMGFYTGLSSNGTLISNANIGRIADVCYDYVGISLDGIGATHDQFRGRDGSFDAALKGLRLCRDHGIKTGMRFTMTMDNAQEFPKLLELMDSERIDKFYLSHLVYAGRGNKNRGDDARREFTRETMDILFDRAWTAVKNGERKEFVTGNNDADGAYLLLWVRQRFPGKAEHIRAKLEQWGGNASGVNIANIDNLGNVHPDTMWWHYSLGNVKQRPFSEIWHDPGDPVMAGLKRRPRAIEGRCSACSMFSICGGNTRVRALQLTGNPWAEDPACYLTDSEIGHDSVAPRLEVTPFRDESMRKRLSSLVGLAFLALAVPAAAQDASPLFQSHCATCHGADRLGGSGPALIPESLGRLKAEQVEKTIASGRPATRMPAFGGTLPDDSIAALAKLVLSPLAEVPKWGESEIAASRIILDLSPPVTKPAYDADPLNLFVVVEAGDLHATILDGDTFAPIARFETRVALHGGPKFTPGGRYVFFMSRDGWVTKFDLWSLKPVAEVRAGINTRNIAISRDGLHLAVAGYLPRSLTILSTATLEVEKIFEVKDRNGKPSRVSAVYQAPQRDSFIAALKDVPEIWEIATDPKASAVFTGLVHSHEKGMEEALPHASGLFALRRIEVSEPIDDFFFDAGYRNLIGASRGGNKAHVINLNVGRQIAAIDLPGMPHLGSGTTWEWNGKPVLAVPHLNAPAVSIIDMTNWGVIKTLTTDGPGFFLRSHENSPYVWADVSGGANKDRMHIIDKRSLEITRTIVPDPGRAAAHVEFDRDGTHVLLSIAEMSGALLVLDAADFHEIKRLPMSKPSGKYNVWNKITFSTGTSH